ncbi:MAG TPA: hypothetical protein VFZ16_13665 [Hyphomicrobiaceae bacterium]|nr:hypothetical protein [Hyphomicrobiaceae bacterium]
MADRPRAPWPSAGATSDIRKTIEIVLRLSDDVKACAEELS